MSMDLDRRAVGVNLTPGGISRLSVRPIAPSDAAALLRFHAHLSRRSIEMRYLYPHLELGTDEVARLTQVDGTRRAAFVVEHRGDLVAVARYERLDNPTMAEVAFVVADGWHHRGIASCLLQRLASRARQVGISTFCAEVRADNAAMLAVFRRAGFPTTSSTEWGMASLTMTIDDDH